MRHLVHFLGFRPHFLQIVEVDLQITVDDQVVLCENDLEHLLVFLDVKVWALDQEAVCVRVRDLLGQLNVLAVDLDR